MKVKKKPFDLHLVHLKLRVFTDLQVKYYSSHSKKHAPTGFITCGVGTGKTHTIIEIIRHLIFPPTGSQEKPKRVLVCGASNLAVDNILERLLLLPPGPRGEKAKVTRIGHPARVMSREDILDSTLEVQSTRSDEVQTHRIPEIPSKWLTMNDPGGTR